MVSVTEPFLTGSRRDETLKQRLSNLKPFRSNFLTLGVIEKLVTRIYINNSGVTITRTLPCLPDYSDRLASLTNDYKTKPKSSNYVNSHKAYQPYKRVH